MTFHKTDRTLVWAHRGASGYAPENTLPAFRRAIELGADGIELDVQLTRDGQIVVIHDEQVGRVSNGKGWVKDLTLDQLKKLDFGRQFSGFEGTRIPTLEEVYTLFRPTSMTINVELKTGVISYPELERRVVELTHRMGMENQVLYSSFNHYSCRKLRELDGDAYIGFLYADGYMGIAGYCRENGGNALHPALYNIRYPDYMKEAAENGLDVNVWTVNEKSHIRSCIDAGVNAVITNYPDRALKIAKEMSEKAE